MVHHMVISPLDMVTVIIYNVCGHSDTIPSRVPRVMVMECCDRVILIHDDDNDKDLTVHYV